MPVSFNYIPLNIRTPGAFIEFDATQANTGFPNSLARILIVGQCSSTSSAKTGMVQHIQSAEQAVSLFGRGSMLAAMILAAKQANDTQEMWALPLADSTEGIAAKAIVSITGTAVKSGVIAVRIGGQLVRTVVAAGQQANAIVSNLTSAINSAADLPVKAQVDAANSSKINLTVNWKGETGNTLDLRSGYGADETLPEGIDIDITPFADGAVNPDVEGPLAALGDTPFQHIVWPYNDDISLKAITDTVKDRWLPLRAINGQVWGGSNDGFDKLINLNTYNSEVLSIIGVGQSPTSPWIIAAVYGAVVAFSLDNDPAQPLQTLALPGILPPTESEQFPQSLRNQLLYKGIATSFVDAAKKIRIERAITAHQVDIYNQSDSSYLDAETLSTLAYLRTSLQTWITQKFSRFKLANDNTRFAPSQRVITPNILKAEILVVAKKWEEMGLIEDLARFKEKLVVERDPNDQNRVNATIEPDTINGFRVFAGNVRFHV